MNAVSSNSTISSNPAITGTLAGRASDFDIAASGDKVIAAIQSARTPVELGQALRFADESAGTRIASARDLIGKTMTKETRNQDGSITIDRTRITAAEDKTVQTRNGPITVSAPTKVEKFGSIRLLPQQSANGAPAVVTAEMQNRLLNFSASSGYTIQITSGIRTPEQNRSVGGASRSAHLSTGTDQAADIKIEGFSPRKTADLAFASGQFNRVNEYLNDRGVHVDLRATGSQGRFTNWEK